MPTRGRRPAAEAIALPTDDAPTPATLATFVVATALAAAVLLLKITVFVAILH